jgi:hypothetical protein
LERSQAPPHSALPQGLARPRDKYASLKIEAVSGLKGGMKLRPVFFLILIFLTIFISGCPATSPMKMNLDILPEPIVGREVTAIVQLRSIQEAPNTKLEIRTSEGIQILSNNLEYDLQLTRNEWVEVKVPFIVLEEGVNLISAYAFNSYEPGSESGFGAGKTLYIRSGLNEAIISENDLSD